MTNPISPIAVTQLPPTSEPFVDGNYYITVDWYHCLFALFQRSGGTGGFDIATIRTTADDALLLASVTATKEAATNILATDANATAITASTTANTAEAISNSNVIAITTIKSAALFKSDNLSGLTDPAQARANIGADTFPLIFNIDSAVSGIKQCIPLWRPMTFDTNFIGSAGYCMTAPTSNLTISINYIRSGTSFTIATMTFFAGGQIAFFTAQPPFSTEAGDILTLTGAADATFAGAGITLLTILG